MAIVAYIALGSNLGDRRGYMERALQVLREYPHVEVTRVSPFYETAPVGGPAGQPYYLNGAAELRTDMTPEELLQVLLATEKRLGRTRRQQDEPRPIDLDLLLYGEVVRSSPDPIVPHPRMHERYFVLKPLADIAPEVGHPILGLTIRGLLERLPAVTANPKRESELAGLKALITGSTRGIGLAIAEEFSSAGAQVILNGRSAEAGTAPQSIPRGKFIAADLALPEERSRFIEEAWTGSDGIDVWINNAGVDTLTGAAQHWTFEQKLHQLIELDIKATVHLSREVGQRMKARGAGVIINMGWDQAETGMEGDSGQLFAVAKSAIMGFSKSLAVSLAPEVRVNCLAPGWIRTSWGETASKRWQERVREETPMARWGAPRDVAAAARWLASPAASFITGQIIRVNGGAVR